MNIAIVGTGYVGLVSGTCFAEMGATVTCVDVDANKINKLKVGEMPIYEPGLEELVKRNVSYGRLNFTTNLTEVLDDVEVVFSAVGTPPDEDGSADLKYVLAVAHQFGQSINKYTILVTKSTVPVGTARKVKAVIQEELDKRGADISFDVASNPEFLKEGAAIKDFMSPDRVVVGIESKKAEEVMTKLYQPFLLQNFRVIFMDIPSAEMTKYAANAMLATRISFMNDIANLCERVGANVDHVRKGIGADVRIGQKFLYAGCGYGGSCFPKDVKALVHTIGDYNQISYNVMIWDTNTHNIYTPSKRRELTEKYYPFFGYEYEKPSTKPVKIGSDCWIAQNAAILKGTELEDEVIVGFCTILLGTSIPFGTTVVNKVEYRFV